MSFHDPSLTDVKHLAQGCVSSEWNRYKKSGQRAEVGKALCAPGNWTGMARWGSEEARPEEQGVHRWTKDWTLGPATSWKALTSRSEVCARVCSVVSNSLRLWTVAHQAPLSMEFSRQKYWSGLPFPTPGDLPDPRIEPLSPASPALAGRFFTSAPPGKPSGQGTNI